MNDNLIQLQVFYEISMSIGQSSNLKEMLKTSLSAYMRKLNCSLGVVLSVERNSPGCFRFEHVFSIPRNVKRNKTFHAIMASLPSEMDGNEMKAFLDGPPRIGSDGNGHSFDIMPLRDFGVLVLAKSGRSLGDYITNSLAPLNRKLAAALMACEHREQIHQMVVSLRQEINERERFECALRESDERLQTIFDSVQAGIMIIDAESHRIVDVNDHALRLIGTAKEDIAAMECHKLVCPSKRGSCPITDQHEIVDNAETVVLKRDGTELPVLKTVTTINLGGKLHLLESFVDLTEKKRLEAQLQQTRKMEAIGNLAGGIAHDFNNLLGSIIGYAEMASEDSPEDSEVRESIDEVLKASARGKELIQQILTFSRGNSAERVPLALGSVVRDILKMYMSSLPSNVVVEQDITGGSDTIMGCSIQVQQVLLNLFTNAVHAMKNVNGILNVSVTHEKLDAQSASQDVGLEEGLYVKITVSDNGHGIDPTALDRVFDPFFTTKSVGEGTGMGLSVVHGIVKSHGGVIKINSTLGEGTTFEVYFPYLEPDSPKDEKATAASVQNEAVPS